MHDAIRRRGGGGLLLAAALGLSLAVGTAQAELVINEFLADRKSVV